MAALGLKIAVSERAQCRALFNLFGHDAAKVGFEPKLSDAAARMNVCSCDDPHGIFHLAIRS